ncbi:MAG: squalene/phytoene synthase family protein [Hyphomicrobiales bacterium]
MGRQALELLRVHDNDRYLSIQFAPAALRDDLAGLFALDIELSRVENLVTEPLNGELRLTWWREALARPGESTGNPVADEVTRAMVAHGLASSDFEAMIDARRLDLYNQPVVDLTELTSYFADTTGTALKLAARVLGSQTRQLADLCIGAALVLGLTRMAEHLASGPARTVSRLIPDEFLRQLPDGEVAVRQYITPELQAGILAQLLRQANETWTTLRAPIEQLPKALLPVFLPLAVVPGALRRYARCVPVAGKFTGPLPRYRRVLKLLINGRRARIV